MRKMRGLVRRQEVTVVCGPGLFFDVPDETSSPKRALRACVVAMGPYEFLWNSAPGEIPAQGRARYDGEGTTWGRGWDTAMARALGTLAALS